MGSTIGRLRRGGEDGFAVVGAVAILAIMLLLAAAAVTGAVDSSGLATRSRNDTQALESAEAAADLAWNRINNIWSSLTLTAAHPCPSFDAAGNVTTVAATTYSGEPGVQWCPSNSVSLPDTTSASYQIEESTAAGYAPQAVVGASTVGSVTRRVRDGLSGASTGTPLFGTYAVESKLSLDFQNGSQVTGGSVRSDGSIKLEDTVVSCHVPNGAITPGPGFTVTTTNGAGTCGQSTTAATSAISWQTITAPGSDNDSQITNGGNIIWSSSNKTLTIQNNSTLTLTGNTYTFCSLNIQNGTLQLQPANGQAVQIYMLPPSSCSGAGVSAGSQTLTLQNNNSYIENSTGLSAQGLQIYMLGATTAYLNNSSAYQFNGVIYAPVNPSPSATSVSIINSAAVKGAIAAYSTVWTANASLTYDATAANVNGGSGGTLYSQSQYLECTPSPAAATPYPDGNCP